MFEYTDYNIFFEFIRNYSGKKFKGIDNKDHFMIRLNRILDNGGQFFYIADLINFSILYTSPQVLDIFGVEPENYDLSYNLKYTHPQDMQRRSRIRAKIIETGQQLFINKTGNMFFSSNFSIKNASGNYSNVLFQCYLFYNSSPFETVHCLMIATPLGKLSKVFKRGHYHWYSGNDPNYFRYPDEELLRCSSNLSVRELEILRYIHEGLDSKEIGEKLHLSIHTVNSHRRNIQKKSGKPSIGELVYELENCGLI